MFIESMALFIGLNTNIFCGSTFTLNQDDLTVTVENRYQLKDFNSKALGFTPESGEYTIDFKYKVASNSDTLAKVFVGFEHKCLHRMDETPTLGNMEYGASNKIYIAEVK